MLVTGVLSAILTAAGSRWIDYLYNLPNAPLSFPEGVLERSKFRKPLMFLLLAVSLLNFAEKPLPEYFYCAAIIFFLTLITFTDFEQYVIFNKMLVPFAVLGICAAIQLNLPLTDRIFAAVIGGGIFLAIAFVSGGGIGGGDIKLVFVLGLWLGSQILLNVVLIASVFGGVVALLLILSKRIDRKSFFAYGPYFTLTTIIILVFAGKF